MNVRPLYCAELCVTQASYARLGLTLSVCKAMPLTRAQLPFTRVECVGCVRVRAGGEGAR